MRNLRHNPVYSMPRRSQRSPKGRPQRRRRRRRGRSARFLGPGGALRRLAAGAVLALALAGATWLVWPLGQLSGQFSIGSARAPSRLYGRPTVLRVGEPADTRRLGRELDGLGYRQTGSASPGPGEYLLRSDRLVAHLRRSPGPAGWREAGRLEAGFAGGRVRQLLWRDQAVAEAGLEPPLVASYYGPSRQERRPVTVGELPEELIHAVLAAEDAGFYRHPGLSLTGILRAAWVNLRGGEVRQGGSTLTQQLVKNLFLSHQRTVPRKLREAALALAVDLRYSKPEILTAYLNEIYWGRRGGVDLMGVGAAAWAYFGKPAAQLELGEAAALAGMIRSPGGYSPVSRPEAARGRRDWVLARMVELDWLAPERAAAASAAPLGVAASPAPVRGSYFADLAAAEAASRFVTGSLAGSGWTQLSTLDAGDQAAAEAALAEGLEAVERGWEKGNAGDGPLQAALVSIDPASGALRAYVGGRDYAASQFDRASRARRQAGSAFKPVVYAAAFERRAATPADRLEDAPLTVALAGRDWSPRNSDDTFRGWVTVRQALEDSLNVPTARLALAVGLPEIVDASRRLGLEGPVEAVPALALGAVEVTPLELAGAYAALAAGGLRHPVHALEAVLDRAGRPLPGQPLPEPRPALTPQTAYMLTSVLQGALERGTGAGARQFGLRDRLAGKTGTTNRRRDSWFAGYSPDRATLVWVGYDDNRSTRLSGARAALPIWARFTREVRPPGGYPLFRQPPGIATAAIDPATGALATDLCPQVITEVFFEGAVPHQVCPYHGIWTPEADWRAERLEDKKRRKWKWLRRLFGRGDRKKKPDRP